MNDAVYKNMSLIRLFLSLNRDYYKLGLVIYIHKLRKNKEQQRIEWKRAEGSDFPLNLIWWFERTPTYYVWLFAEKIGIIFKPIMTNSDYKKLRNRLTWRAITTSLCLSCPHFPLPLVVICTRIQFVSARSSHTLCRTIYRLTFVMVIAAVIVVG